LPNESKFGRKHPWEVLYKVAHLLASTKAYQLLARGRWFSPASFTTKTGRNDIADILLKVVLKHQKSNQIKSGQVYMGNRRKITEDISQVGLYFLSIFQKSQYIVVLIGRKKS
jgi:hypothetical protein